MRSRHQNSFRDGTTPPHGRCPSTGGHSNYDEYEDDEDSEEDDKEELDEPTHDAPSPPSPYADP